MVKRPPTKLKKYKVLGLTALARVLYGPLVVVLLLMGLPAAAQDTSRVRRLEWSQSDLPPAWARRLRQLASDAQRRPLHADSLAQRIVRWLQAEGYAEASVAVRQTGDTAQVTLHAGRQYWLDSLHVTGLTPQQLLTLGLPLNKPQPWGAAAIARHTTALLQLLADEGHPFAQLSAPEVQFQQGAEGDVRVRMAYTLTPGPLAVLDSILPVGPIRERPAFVQGLTGLQPGQLYRARDIAAVPNLLNNTLYFQQVQPPLVRFRPPPPRGNLAQDDSAGIYRADVRIPMQPRKANRFDALLGILPPQGESQQEWQVTALLDILLVSPLRAGEVLSLRYEQFPNQSRRVDLRLLVPNLFRTPLRAELRFDLQRQDTSFLTLNLEPIAWWYFSPRLAARLLYRSRTSTYLAGQTQTALIWPPPAVLDGSTTQWGLGLRYERLDRRLNPTRGWLLDAEYAIGTKTVDRSPRLPNLDYTRLRLTQPRRDLRVLAQHYAPLGRRQVLASSAIGQWVDLAEAVANDLVFVGGARSLRGFTENSFLASLWLQGSLEYRLLLDDSSFLAPFVDYALVQQRTLQGRRTWHPLGVGLALNVGTQAGLVNVTYAVGRSEDQPFRPAEGRIHIGFISQF